MSLQVEKLEKNMAKLTIEVPVEDLEKGIEAAYKKNKNQISVPGFRKGKVPRAMIEKMYGKDVFLGEAADNVMPEAYAKAVEECEEEIVSSPTVDVVQLEAGKPFIFTAEVALKPPVELGKYKGVKIDKIEIEVTDAELNEALEKERENNARIIAVEDRPVKDGDMTVIDFEGFSEGVAFEGGQGENYPLTIGSGSFIPGFEEQLIGVKLEEEAEVNVMFPEEYHADNLAGKPALFKVVVKEIKERELPELDDEFASEVSEFDTLAEYKEEIKKDLSEKKTEEAKNKKEQAVIEAIVEDSKMEVPDAMIETQQRQMVDEFAQRLQMQGMSLEQYGQFTGLTADKMLEQVKPQAESRIKSSLILEAIVKVENIVPNEEQYKKELERLASVYQMESDKVEELLGEKGKEEVLKDLSLSLAAEFVVEHAKEK